GEKEARPATTTVIASPPTRYREEEGEIAQSSAISERHRNSGEEGEGKRRGFGAATATFGVSSRRR
ncbi:hypothetical protein U1Q18_036535, partial [Sarracenia purpurea var. burkii]